MMIKRLITKHLVRLAKQHPVITLTGPRQSGKTTLCKSVFPNYKYVNMEDLTTRSYANDDPRGFLQQFDNASIILDEIQHTPNLPSYIQTIVDANSKVGQFILAGSQQFEVINTVSN